jgi:hypothetical protein
MGIALAQNIGGWFKGVSVVLKGRGQRDDPQDRALLGIETVGRLSHHRIRSRKRRNLSGTGEKVAQTWSTSVLPLPDVVEGFGMLANHLGHPLTDPLRHLQRVIHDPAELAILPDRYGAFLEARIFWTPLYRSGPDAGAAFRVFSYISTPPGMAPDPYMDPIEKDARSAGIKVLDTFSSGATTVSPYRDASGQLMPFLRVIQRVTEARYPGVPFGPVPTFGGVTTSVLFATMESPHGCSPTPSTSDTARRHSDERIYLRDYVDGVDLYKELLPGSPSRATNVTGPATKRIRQWPWASFRGFAK